MTPAAVDDVFGLPETRGEKGEEGAPTQRLGWRAGREELVLPLEVVPAVVAVAMEEGEPLGGHPTEGGGVLIHVSRKRLLLGKNSVCLLVYLPVEEAMRVELAAVAMVTSAGCLTLAAFPRGVAETAVAMAAASEVFPASLVATAALLGTAPHSKAEVSVAPPGPVAREEVFGCRVAAAPRVGMAAELSPTEGGAVGSLQTKPSSLPPLPLSLSPCLTKGIILGLANKALTNFSPPPLPPLSSTISWIC